MKEFYDYILKFGNINPQQIDFIAKKANELEFHKDEYYWEAGKAVKQIGFITEGIFGCIIIPTKAKKNTALLC
jgi:hypothetical protein